MGGQYCGNIRPALKSHVIVIVSTNLVTTASPSAKAPHISVGVVKLMVGRES